MQSPRLLLYRFKSPQARLPAAVIFWTDPRITAREVSQAVREFSENEMPVSHLIALTLETCESVLNTCLEDRESFRLPNDGVLDYAVFRRDLAWHASTQKAGRYLADAIEGGFQAIFRSRNGVLVAGNGFHYEKPSGQHSKKFLRAANVLNNSNEIAFFAMEVAKRLGSDLLSDTEHIYTDTSAINSLAYALGDILRDLRVIDAPFAISSFGSYAGLEMGFVPYNVAKSICLMSATTSGNLERKLKHDYGFSSKQVVTLFAANKVDDCDILFNTSDVEGEPFGPIKNFKEGACEYCNRQEKVIRISGDQFLPEGPRVSSFKINADALPREAEALINDIVGKGVAVCNAWNDAKRVPVSFLLFRQKLFSAAEREILDRLHRMVPHKATRILVSSGAFPELDLDMAAEFPNVSPTRVPDEVLAEKALFVLCPLNYGGGEATSVALRLRSAERSHQRSFLIGISVFETKAQLDDFTSNIRFGRHPGDYHADMPYKINLPAVFGNRKTPWEAEISYWAERLPAFDGDAASAIEDRLDRLSKGEEGLNAGLQQHVFLPAIQGVDLKMSPGFAFWREKSLVGSQADVFLTVAAILKNLRDKNPSSRNEHSLEVLHPSTFFRYTDSGIQAAFLRALEGAELNYSASQDLSDFFARVFEFVLERRHREEGYAASEFCYALVTGKVRLASGGMEQCLRAIKQHLKADAHPWATVYRILASSIKT